MKKGMILYVTQGKNELTDTTCPDISDLQRELDVHFICLTTSEDEISDAWWRMTAAGTHQISCMHACYHASTRRLELGKHRYRLAG